VDPVTASITIDAPRQEVFDYLQDIANHPEFTDHYLVDWRLTREDSVGRGAGARFRIKGHGPGQRFNWGDVTFVDVQPPHKIVEVGRRGKFNRIRTVGAWELADGPNGTTHVRFTLETEPRTRSDRIAESLGQRRLRRKSARALRRLRSILELGEDRGSRATLAGG
jgi:uncharacterized protein YndB with AHSA1/START domain